MLGLLSNMPLLSVLLWLPLVFGILTAVSRGRFLRIIAVLGSGSALILSFVLLFAVLYNNTGNTWSFVEKKDLLLFKYYIGIDGISAVLVCLAALIMMICCLYSCFVAGQDPVHIFLLLVLETLIFGVFVSIDLLLFYIFFEASIVPLFLIIGLAGSRERIFSAFKMFMYSIVGSILLLFAILYLCLIAKVSDLNALNAGVGMLSRNMQGILWFALFTAFAIKLPMLPLHSWLPNAHANAPTVGSVVLAAVILKLGSYGMLRFVVPAFPEINRAFSYPLCCISVAAVLYGALVAFVQKDLKKTIAYSSISHMGFVTAGMFAYNTKALIGSIFEMVSHGLSSAAMFLCAGFLYKRSKSRQLSSFGGYFAKMPVLAAFFLLFMFAAIGVPGTSGFVSEFLVVLGAGSAHFTMVPFLVLGLVFSAVYMLSLYKIIFTGNYNKAATAGIVCDLSMPEVLLLLPLTVGLLFLGICPSFLLNLLEDCIVNIALIKN